MSCTAVGWSVHSTVAFDGAVGHVKDGIKSDSDHIAPLGQRAGGVGFDTNHGAHALRGVCIRVADCEVASEGVNAHAYHRRLSAAFQQQWRRQRHALQCQRGCARGHKSTSLRRSLEEPCRRKQRPPTHAVVKHGREVRGVSEASVDLEAGQRGAGVHHGHSARRECKSKGSDPVPPLIEQSVRAIRDQFQRRATLTCDNVGVCALERKGAHSCHPATVGHV